MGERGRPRTQARLNLNPGLREAGAHGTDAAAAVSSRRGGAAEPDRDLVMRRPRMRACRAAGGHLTVGRRLSRNYSRVSRGHTAPVRPLCTHIERRRTHRKNRDGFACPTVRRQWSTRGDYAAVDRIILGRPDRQPLLLGRAVRLHPLAVVLAIATGLITAGRPGCSSLSVPILYARMLAPEPDPWTKRDLP